MAIGPNQQHDNRESRRKKIIWWIYVILVVLAAGKQFVSLDGVAADDVPYALLGGLIGAAIGGAILMLPFVIWHNWKCTLRKNRIIF
jgi:hypothetical protein